ncbi:glycoside hydrolase family 18 protein [Xylariales sp. AK1849]|nr:glycoside hydrolase family 18 protein [Xylariales sp. AK1849]
MTRRWPWLPSQYPPWPLFLLGVAASTLLFSFPAPFFGSHVAKSATGHHIWSSSNTLSNGLGSSNFRRADEYTCTADQPCSNGACCGSFLGTDTGTCGYGPTYCGTDCTSNCNATAECGQYAVSGDEYCPLNVCCSEWGFCGTSSDFCGDGCQNNCVESPSVPSGANSDGVLTKVIGYYEAWANSRECYAFPPSAIPISGLTHVNFAFAYINPDTFEIAIMEADIPTSLFVETADIRTLKSNTVGVEVFLSIGGWSFSDNDTVTQPIFSNIAASSANRLIFANNLVGFLKEYGFDGVDFDWEYPGAPDRGGKEEDKYNYVALLQTVRQVFDESDGEYGISFTAPSSYWYLRWFDLPGMIEYADWVNLMTYDLHGVWDSTDPIGSIVQAHTNLTEIKTSVELFWRENVPPEKIVLGLGFYGRSFQLKDTSCSTPGCAFAGAATAGTCTNNPGTLAYFEIMDILADQNPKVVWDKTDAVKYMQYGTRNDQWVSYDDADTFKQKVEWANGLGLGGVMIWSVDQDTADFDALTGLLGKELPTFFELTEASTAVAGNWASQNGQDCKMTDCLEDSEVGSWGSSWALAPNGGAFKDTCGSSKNKYIICPTSAMPSTCQWRGGETGAACHGQCHSGEVTLFHSKHATVSCFTPGYQAFCCESNTWAELVGSCGWSNDDTCGASQTWVAMRKVYMGTERELVDATEIYENQAYCCQSGFDECHWIGQGTCDDNECADYEIELCTDDYGNTTSLCARGWNGRSKVLCCTPPSDLNPFLPASLENIFPTLPPTTDTPDFDIESIQTLPGSSGSDTVSGAFGFVVIDGPSDAVASLTKRDDSHIQFLECDASIEKRDAVAVYTARYICMNDSDKSNCDVVHEGGAPGTVVKLPEDCGFATYGVVQDIRPSSNQTVHAELLRRAPSKPTVYEIDIGYNYSMVKRASGDIYVRIDYGDVRSYWVDIVEGDHAKRDVNATMDRRFWSNDASTWAREFNAIRTSPLPSGYNLNLEKQDFYQLLFEQDGSANCGGEDGYMSMYLEGTASSALRWGVTMVGTISPTLNFEEAYGFFDADMTLTAALMMNGQASIQIDGSTKQSSLFASDISNFAYSEPGIVSFKPKMNVETSLQGQGTINVDARLTFQTGTDEYARTNAPLSLGDLSGDVLNLAVRNAWDGYVDGSLSSGTSTVGKRASGEILLGLNLDMRTWLEIDVFEMGTNNEAADGQFIIDTTHYINVVADGDVISVISGDQNVGVEAYSVGISADWEEDDSSHRVGATGTPYVIYSGSGDPPPTRSPPAWGSDGEEPSMGGAYFSCSNNSTSAPVCYQSTNMSSFDDAWSIDPETGNRYADEKRKRFLNLDHFVAPPPTLEHLLEPRGTGGGRNFTVRCPSGSTFLITSHTYPNGLNGGYLLAQNPSAGYYLLANPANCEDFSVTANGNPAGSNWVTEHIVELGTLNLMLQFMMFGTFTLPDGTVFTTDVDTVDESFFNLASFLQTPWNQWAPGETSTSTPLDDLWTAFGDTTNPDVLVNCERIFNGVKMQIWQGNSPMADGTWDTNDFDDTSEIAGPIAAQGGISTVRLAAAIFEYLDDSIVNVNMATVLNAFYDIWHRFDDGVLAASGTVINTRRLYSDFVYRALIPRLEGVQGWAERRLEAMIANWEAVLNQPTSSSRATEVGEILESLNKLLEKVKEESLVVNTGGLNFDP